MIGNLYETTEATLVAAHKNGAAYWTRNRTLAATKDRLSSLARSIGFHGQENEAWLAGYYGAKRRDQNARI
jgi:hypothetical protein